MQQISVIVHLVDFFIKCRAPHQTRTGYLHPLTISRHRPNILKRRVLFLRLLPVCPLTPSPLSLIALLILRIATTVARNRIHMHWVPTTPGTHLPLSQLQMFPTYESCLLSQDNIIPDSSLSSKRAGPPPNQRHYSAPYLYNGFPIVHRVPTTPGTHLPLSPLQVYPA